MQTLIEALSKVQNRCRQHGGALQNNEMLTRYSLIDPVLRALGWDTENPDMVVPEFTTPTGRIDYVLFWDSQPYIGIEAKALGTNLQQARQMGFQYCWQNQIPYFVATDGDIWELHDMSALGGQQIFCVQICGSQNLGHIALVLLGLDYRAMPIRSPSPSSASLSPVSTAAPAMAAPSSSIAASAPLVPSSPGRSFANLTQNDYPVTGTRPQHVIFPNNVSVPVRTWKGVLIKVIETLDQHKCLPQPPFKVGVQQRTILYDTNAQTMSSPGKVQTTLYGTIYVNFPMDAQEIAKFIYQLLNAAKQQCPSISPETVCVVL